MDHFKKELTYLMNGKKKCCELSTNNAPQMAGLALLPNEFSDHIKVAGLLELVQCLHKLLTLCRIELVLEVKTNYNCFFVESEISKPIYYTISQHFFSTTIYQVHLKFNSNYQTLSNITFSKLHGAGEDQDEL